MTKEASPQDKDIEQMNDDEVMENLLQQFGEEPEDDHFHNLVDDFSDQELNKIANYVIEGIENDEKSREGWLNIGNKGLQALGIGNSELVEMWGDDAALGCNISSPAYTETYLSVYSTFQKELFSGGEYADTTISGKPTPEKKNRASAKKAFMNNYLSNIYPNFKGENNSLLGNLIIWGTAFKKTYKDPLTGAIRSPFVSAKDIIINNDASDWDNITQITHQFSITKKELVLRQRKGFYKDLPIKDLTKRDSQTTMSSTDQLMAQMEGFSTNYLPSQPSYTICESQYHLDPSVIDNSALEDENTIPKPYIITLERESRKVLRICRNWHKDDSTYKRIDCVTPYYMLKGLKLYGYGMAQMVAAYAEQSSDLLDTTLENVKISNNSGGLIDDIALSKLGTSDITLERGKLKGISIGGDNINNFVSYPPMKDVSPLTMDLMQKLDDSIRNIMGIVSMPLEKLPSNAPSLPLIGIMEMMGTNQSTLQKQFYDSFKIELRKIADLMASLLPSKEMNFSNEDGGYVVSKEYFLNNSDVIPAFDPNINSTPVRMLKAEKLYELANNHPDLFNMEVILQNYISELRVGNPKEYLIPNPQAEEMEPLDPMTENMNAALGKQLVVGRWQDHPSHITTHESDIMQEMQKGESANMQVIQTLTQHNMEHKLQLAVVTAEQQTGIKFPKDVTSFTKDQQNMIAQMLAQQIMEQQQQEQQMMQQQQQGQPTPEMLLQADIENKNASLQFRQQESMAKNQLEQMKMANEQQKVMFDQQMQQLRIQKDAGESQAEAELARMRFEKEQQEMEFKQAIEEMRVEIERMRAMTDKEEAMIHADLEEKKLETQTELENRKLDQQIAIKNEELALKKPGDIF